PPPPPSPPPVLLPAPVMVPTVTPPVVQGGQDAVVSSQGFSTGVSVPAEDVVNSLPEASASITNNQEANVDEGDIVKVRGNILVILRRGRLFTVSLAGGTLRPIDMINAFPPGVSGEDDWYDEMLISGDQVVVIGYSYARGGTEINRFRLSPDGHIRFRDAYHLRSSDYFSSEN